MNVLSSQIIWGFFPHKIHKTEFYEKLGVTSVLDILPLGYHFVLRSKQDLQIHIWDLYGNNINF